MKPAYLGWITDSVHLIMKVSSDHLKAEAGRVEGYAVFYYDHFYNL
jgi:hypothetical protein